MADHFSEFDAFNVPPEFRPLGTLGYIGYSILFSIPLIGWIFIVIFSFSDANINRRNYARFHLIFLILGIICMLILFFMGYLNASIEAIREGEWLLAYQKFIMLGK